MPRYRPVDPGQRFPSLEEDVLKRWRERDVFHATLTKREGGPLYVFYEGPPTANGAPGSHHVLSRVFKDIFPRYKTMCGYYVPRKAGWDCHGLPVELEVERALGIGSKEEIERYGIAEFNQKCRESVFSYVEDWNRLTERIAFWIDLDDAYVTLANEYIESVWWSLKEIWDQGLLYQGHKVVPYCPRCGTPLSSHEVALGYHDVVDPSIYVRFPVTEGAGPVEKGDDLLIWTTTPWTLVSNAVVAVNPELTYVRARKDGTVYVLAESRLEPVLDEAEVIGRFRGAELEGTRYDPPFEFIGADQYGPRAHGVLPADFVTADEGTGLVHTAIAFGEDDFRLGEQYGLNVVNPVRADGTFDERIGPFAGRFVKDADPDLIADLEARGRLLRAEEYEHSYPHCWRCDTPLLYYAKESWYIQTTARRDDLLRANEEVEWYPFHIKHGRFGKWLENNVDWALSRERYWATPLPVWRCGEGHDRCVGSIGELRDLATTPDIPDDLHRPYIDEVKLRCPDCGGEMERVPEVIDAWYDSGAMPFAQHHYPFENETLFKERFPADFICEAVDQTRGWFYSLLAESTLLFGRSPYKNVLCLGLILDPEGQKMSKSRGNVVEPWDVIDTHGADALRWYYFTSQQPWSGYRFSIEAVGESVRKFLHTLWNTYYFYVLYANVDGFDHSSHRVPVEDRPDLDRWAISRLQGTIRTVREGLDSYDTTSAGRAIAGFVDDLSNWYVRRSRRRFWSPSAARDGERDTADKVAAYLTLYECLVTAAKLLAPFTPFVSEELYTNLDGGEDSVHLCDFPEADESLVDKELDFDMAVARRTVELGRAARSQAKIKVRQPLREAVVVANERERAAIARLEDLVLDELNVKEVSYVSEADELGEYEVKPNYRQLGPRFGKRMSKVAEAIERIDPSTVAAALDRGESVEISLDGERELLEPEDLSLVMLPRGGYQLERQANYAVALKLELDEELRREGVAREVVHAVQNARKGAGLRVEDRIELALSGDGDLLEAVRQHADYVAGETLATRLELDGSRPEDAHLETARIDGYELGIALKAAG